jgi:uncharacterized protein (TIGR03437 family)
VLFLARGNSSLAVSAQTVSFYPVGVTLSLAGGNPAPSLSFSDPFPAVVNSYSGFDPTKWLSAIPEYHSATLASVYQGVDVRYLWADDGSVTLQLTLQPGIPSSIVAFDVNAASLTISPLGSLIARTTQSLHSPSLVLPPPVATQLADARTASYVVLSPTRFGVAVPSVDESTPLQINITLQVITPPNVIAQARDSAGNTYLAVAVADSAGKTPPFANQPACGTFFEQPIGCVDVAIHKLSPDGNLLFTTYLSGSTGDVPASLLLAPDGGVWVTGTTDSADFPTSAGAFQRTYGGPAATPSSSNQYIVDISGDFFAARISSLDGTLQAATYLGGPSPDRANAAALGSDGSLYFMPNWLNAGSPQMPVTGNALLKSCGDPCQNGYAAHLSPSLDRLLYGTYLPGIVQSTAHLYIDGSLYFAGTSGPGFPVTASAYQQQPAGGDDGFVARLDPTGSNLIFGTYIGSTLDDSIIRMAVAPDGSSWASVSSVAPGSNSLQYRLVHLDVTGSRLLADAPIDVDDIAVDNAGNTWATSPGGFPATAGAFLESSCGGSPEYLGLGPAAEVLFATYLPADADTDFQGVTDTGTPILRVNFDSRAQVIENQPAGVYAGCVEEGANFSNPGSLVPGQIVSIFGTGMGPSSGLSYTLVEGKVPTTLGGVRVLTNVQPIPLLYVSGTQINAILPFDLALGSRPVIQVDNNGQAGNEFSYGRVDAAAITLFRVASGLAAALNQDGTVNSPTNPAQPGTVVMLFGTGGGVTSPPSTDGEVTPPEQRLLNVSPSVVVPPFPPGTQLDVQYAGAAPGLVAGVVQLNVKLPEDIPATILDSSGNLPLEVMTPTASYNPNPVPIAVKVK